MSKMREAADKHISDIDAPYKDQAFDDFCDGWKAAIAAVKEGGAIAYEIETSNNSFTTPRGGSWLAYSVEDFSYNKARCLDITKTTQLYKLPED